MIKCASQKEQIAVDAAEGEHIWILLVISFMIFVDRNIAHKELHFMQQNLA
jgi:hypothetical protein